MAPIELTPIELEEVVKLRKPHACGGYEWTIVRLGADIGLRCNTCGRRVLLPRREFERRLVKKLTPMPAQALNQALKQALNPSSAQSSSSASNPPRATLTGKTGNQIANNVQESGDTSAD